MNTNELAFFTSSVNRLIEGQLILVDKHIATVLKSVAKSPTLCRVLSNTHKNMSYATEFSRARVTWTSVDGVRESRLKLPVDRSRQFAFVVCLLTEVDCGKRNFLDFLREYYNAGDNDASYARFASEVLKPFKSAGENFLREVDPESLDAEYVSQAEQYFASEKMYVQTNTLAEIFSLMEEVRLILIDQRLGADDLAEVALTSEYLVNALYLKNPKIIKICFIAYKNTLKGYSIVSGKLEQIVKLFNTFI